MRTLAFECGKCKNKSTTTINTSHFITFEIKCGVCNGPMDGPFEPEDKNAHPQLPCEDIAKLVIENKMKKAEIQDLKDALKVAINCLETYADIENWFGVQISFYENPPRMYTWEKGPTGRPWSLAEEAVHDINSLYTRF